MTMQNYRTQILEKKICELADPMIPDTVSKTYLAKNTDDVLSSFVIEVSFNVVIKQKYPFT